VRQITKGNLKGMVKELSEFEQTNRGTKKDDFRSALAATFFSAYM
jgi:hypothetical protein